MTAGGHSQQPSYILFQLLLKNTFRKLCNININFFPICIVVLSNFLKKYQIKYKYNLLPMNWTVHFTWFREIL